MALNYFSKAMVVYATNTQEEEAGGSVCEFKASLVYKSLFQDRPQNSKKKKTVLKKQKEKEIITIYHLCSNVSNSVWHMGLLIYSEHQHQHLLLSKPFFLIWAKTLLSTA